MRNKIVETSNISALLRALESLENRAAGEEGMGLFFGVPGAGKSTALAYAADKLGAVRLRACATWSITAMLGTLLAELGLSSTGSRHVRLERIVEHLAMYRRPILVDEADYLLRNPDQLDVLRDVYDLSGVPLMLVGMPDAPRTLRSHPRMARHRRRVTRWIEAGPLTLDELARVAEELCEVQIDEALLGRLHGDTHGNIGLSVIGLGAIERFGQANGLAVVAAEAMQGIDLLEG